MKFYLKVLLSYCGQWKVEDTVTNTAIALLMALKCGVVLEDTSFVIVALKCGAVLEDTSFVIVALKCGVVLEDTSFVIVAPSILK